MAEQASIKTLGKISPAFKTGYIVSTIDTIKKYCEWLEGFGFKIIEGGDYQSVIEAFSNRIDEGK